MLGRTFAAAYNYTRLATQKGQSIVEMTLLTPLLLVALYIPADFGIGLLTAHLTQNAVREAARIAVSTKDPFNTAAANSVGDDALANLPSRLTSPTVTVEYYGSGATNCLQGVKVTAHGTYTFFLYQLIRLLGFPLNQDSTAITRATIMRYEFQPVTNSTLCTSVTVTATRS